MAGHSPTAHAPAAHSSLERFYRQHVTWASCAGHGGPTAKGIDLECASIVVPLDYAKPGGRTLTIALDRAPATGKRIGALVVNPGGPGESGLDAGASLATRLPATIRARFDIVGFDPRGVGRSERVHCASTALLDRVFAAPWAPTTSAQVSALLSADRTLTRGCVDMSGWELPYIGTSNAAKDLDVIRAVLGETRLTYLGYSYGTYLGATYADEFPQHVRALVLDGAVDPAVKPESQAEQQAVAFQRDLDDFLADCVQRADCPLGRTTPAAHAALDDLLSRVAAHPLPAIGLPNGPLTQGLADYGVLIALYSPTGWPLLREALADAEHGNGALLLALADDYLGRTHTGYDGTMESYLAISCADEATSFSVQRAATDARSWSRLAPFFGASSAWGLLTCADWPTKPGELQLHHAVGAPPIVVVGTTRDPATPYAWAEGLARELASGRLVTVVADGHTSYGTGKSPCLDRLVDAYLVSGAVPPAGTVCH